MNTKLTRGIVYIGMYPGSWGEAQIAAKSARQHMPDIPIWVYTDQSGENDIFTNIVKIPPKIDHPQIAQMVIYPIQAITAKVRYMYDAPFDIFLFLDADTTLLGPVDEIFDALEFGCFDLALVMNSQRYDINGMDKGMPACAPVYNSGVVGIRRSPRMDRWYQRYWELYLEQTLQGIGFADQLTLRRAIYECQDIRVLTMPEEYNAYYSYTVYLSGYTKILHGRACNKSVIAEGINKTINAPRVWQGESLVCSQTGESYGLVMHR